MMDERGELLSLLKLPAYQADDNNGNMSKINVAKIRRIAQDSPTALMLFAALARRDRDRHTTDIKRMRLELTQKGKRLEPQQIRDFFRALEEAGVGKVQLTKAGYEDVFEWFTSLRKVGEIGTGKLKTIPDDALDVAERRTQSESMRTHNEGDSKPVDKFIHVLLTNDRISDADKVKMLKAYLNIN